MHALVGIIQDLDHPQDHRLTDRREAAEGGQDACPNRGILRRKRLEQGLCARTPNLRQGCGRLVALGESRDERRDCSSGVRAEPGENLAGEASHGQVRVPQRARQRRDGTRGVPAEFLEHLTGAETYVGIAIPQQFHQRRYHPPAQFAHGDDGGWVELAIPHRGDELPDPCTIRVGRRADRRPIGDLDGRLQVQNLDSEQSGEFARIQERL